MNLMGTDGNVIATSRGTGDNEKWYLYNKDSRGSTSSLINSTGAAAAAYAYDDFGDTTVKVGADFDNEICYTGQVYDESTGLYYYNARYYDPEDGRFLTQDTYRGEQMDPGTWNLYTYCANDPVNYVDPSGHAAIWLNAKKAAFGQGHAAVLIYQGSGWAYWSWDNKEFGRKHNGKIYKGNRTKAIKWANKLRKKQKAKKYTHYAYLKGDFKKSHNYAWKVKSGQTKYNSYSLTGVNCAWMAIQLLRQGNVSSKKNKKLKNFQWKRIWVNGLGQYRTVKRVIIPNKVGKTIAKIFNSKYRKI